MTYAFEMYAMLYGIGVNDNQTVALAPSDQIDSYRKGVENFLGWLEYAKASTPPQQYERDKLFYSEMKRLLA